MGNACRSFGFDDDEGMRVFSIAEMFLALYHVICASYVYSDMVKCLYRDYREKEKISSSGLAMLIISCVFMFLLILHAVLGFLLYMKGWKERNATICYIWMVVASINLFLSFCIALIDVIGGLDKWRIFLLYLMYVIYGVWVVRSFLKWAHERGFHNAACCASLKRGRNVNASPVRVTVHSNAHGGSGPNLKVPATTPKIVEPEPQRRSNETNSTRHTTQSKSPPPPPQSKPPPQKARAIGSASDRGSVMSKQSKAVTVGRPRRL